MSTEEGIPWFLNFCYSHELHKRKQNLTDPMKWSAPYGSSSEKRLLGTQNFPALRLCNRNHLPHQKDTFNCGVGACAGIAIVLQNFLQNKNKASWFDSRSRRNKQSMIFLQDKTTQELYVLFPQDFLEPVSTKNDLVWENYLDCLQEEWFVLFDRLVFLQYVTLPQRINRENAVDPLYSATLKALNWPDKEDQAQSMKLPRKKALSKMAWIETDSSGVGRRSSGSSTLAQVSQTQDSADNEMGGMDAELNVANDDDANNDINIGTDVDNEELIGGIVLTSGDGASSMPYTKGFITNHPDCT